MSREIETMIAVMGFGLLLGAGILVIGMALGLPYEMAKLAGALVLFGLFMLALEYGMRRFKE